MRIVENGLTSEEPNNAEGWTNFGGERSKLQ